jgi:hypothetical protein
MCRREATVRSAAAIDSNYWSPDRPIARAIRSGLGVNLGAYLPNPALSVGARVLHGLMPIGYFAYRHTPDVFGTHFYLSDGGHSDNLGVFSLLQRGCKRIVVVDGEEDRHYQFEGYFLLKRHLQMEYQKADIDLQIDDIWKPLDDQAKRRFKELKLKEIRRMAADGTLIDYLHQGDSKLADSPTSAERRKCYGRKAVMRGELTSKTGDHPIQIFYAKLAYKPVCDLTEAPRYFAEHYRGPFSEVVLGKPCANPHGLGKIEAYYYCQIEKCARGRILSPLGDCAPFPQQPTRDQNFNPTQFEAYVELGCLIGRETAERLRHDDTEGPGHTRRERDEHGCREVPRIGSDVRMPDSSDHSAP